MKLDVEAMAREAGLEVHPGKHQIRVGMDAITGFDSTAKVEAFARLIVERCAVECIAVEVPDGINEAPFSRATAFGIGTENSAAAIRNLLED